MASGAQEELCPCLRPVPTPSLGLDDARIYIMCHALLKIENVKTNGQNKIQ